MCPLENRRKGLTDDLNKFKRSILVLLHERSKFASHLGKEIWSFFEFDYNQKTHSS